MSKRRVKAGAKPTASKTAQEAPEPPAEKPSPLTPRPKLFTVLLIAFGIWLGLLLTLYFTKVYPQRHATSAPVTTRS